jgi:hypothetical protein
MEEKKNKTNSQKVEKPTVEQLENYCNQLLSQRNQLAQRLNEVQNVLNKLPFLFKVVENSEKFGKDFTAMCIEEIKMIMTPPPVEENQNVETPSEA